MEAGPETHLCIAYFEQEVPPAAYEGLSEGQVLFAALKAKHPPLTST
jgi:hypothetical protein